MKKYVRIRTRNSTASPLRRSILVDDWAVVRLGSLTPVEEIFPNHHRRGEYIEINSPEAIRNSSSKLRMKRCFNTKAVPQADGWTTSDGRIFHPITTENGNEISDTANLPYPMVAKRVFGCQGKGMELLENEKALKKFFSADHDLYNWIFEEFYNYGREYRLHVAKGIGVFMSWRKLRRNDTKEDRWFFNNANSNWVGPGHGSFDKPKCWRAMVKAAKDSLEACGLDIGACDIRVQTSKQANPKFIVCEINSAPSLGEMGIIEYRKVIKRLINNKKNDK
jgi:glutathione synthase/RimK-type ligase-like ATP-grasp enzyme